jgi:low temperature requirement protein LtrA
MLAATTLLLIAAATDGKTQTALWAAALLADYGGTYIGGASGWRIASASHFAERHGLILIIALGEYIVAIGVGIADKPISWAIIAASILGLALSAALWGPTSTPARCWPNKRWSTSPTSIAPGLPATRIATCICP